MNHDWCNNFDKRPISHPDPVDLSTILSNRGFVEWSRREGCHASTSPA